MSNYPIISANNLSFSYNGEIVLKNVNLTINENDFVWIVGPNGGGKTTLLKLILGLLKPKIGDIKILGNSPQKARKYIGYMSQHILLDSQFPVNVLDVVLMGRIGNSKTIGPFRSTDKEIAHEVLKQVGLFEYRHKQFSQLSGGQQRRLLIARALVSRPKILLLDEPTANLDADSEKDLFELLHKLNKELTIILVSHDPAFVSAFVKRVVCVNGEVHEHPTAEIAGSYVSELYGDQRRIVQHNKHIEDEK